MSQLVRVLSLLVLGCAASDLAGQEEALLGDDECGADGAEGAQCALNALQLRGQAVHEVRGGAGSEENHVAGMSGAMAANQTEVEGSAWPSCARYGCHARYNHHLSCQCNSKCHRYSNCCGDYDAKCSHASHPSHSGGGKASCSAIPSCAPLGLGGDCCPTPRGDYLGCCPESMVPHATAPPPTTVNGRSMMKLYHQTSPDICKLIMANGFKIGHGGWCGNAIYFALSPEATKTKAITPHSGAGCVIEATVDVGRVKKFPCCRYCGGRQDEHVYWTEGQLAGQGYGSIEINPGDGPEIVIYSNKQVLSMRVLPWTEAWRPHKMHYRE